MSHPPSSARGSPRVEARGFRRHRRYRPAGALRDGVDDAYREVIPLTNQWLAYDTGVPCRLLALNDSVIERRRVEA